MQGQWICGLFRETICKREIVGCFEGSAKLQAEYLLINE